MRTKAIVMTVLALAGMMFYGPPGIPAEKQTQPAGPQSLYFNNGSVFIVSSSHQDTAWMDTPAACRQYRIEHVILPALELMRNNPDYTFCMEGTLHLMEFLGAHPERRDEIIQRMKEGRLEFGATFNEPYESWLSGEELVRETYFGRRWIKKNLPGCDARVAFNPDPPGRSLQMQQILSKAGIPYMFISRYHEGLYRWQSPDGTGVLLYSPGHYGNHRAFLSGKPEECARAILEKLQQQGPYYEQRSIPPTYCLINSEDFSKPVDFSPLIRSWNQQPAAPDGARPPLMRYASIRGFFESIDKPSAHFDTLMGERPDVWVYNRSDAPLDGLNQARSGALVARRGNVHNFRLPARGKPPRLAREGIRRGVDGRDLHRPRHRWQERPHHRRGIPAEGRERPRCRSHAAR